jgi:hypothetical protein
LVAGVDSVGRGAGSGRPCCTECHAPVLRIRRARQHTVPARSIRPLPLSARLLRRAGSSTADTALPGERSRGVADGSHRRPNRQACQHRDRPGADSRMSARPGGVLPLLGVPGAVHRAGRGHGMRVRFGHRPAVRPARASWCNGQLRQDQVPVHHARDGHLGSRHRPGRSTAADLLGSRLRRFGGVPRPGRGGADVTGARGPRRGRGGRARGSRGARRRLGMAGDASGRHAGACDACRGVRTDACDVDAVHHFHAEDPLRSGSGHRVGQRGHIGGILRRRAHPAAVGPARTGTSGIGSSSRCPS